MLEVESLHSFRERRDIDRGPVSRLASAKQMWCRADSKESEQCTFSRIRARSGSGSCAMLFSWY